MRDSSEDLHEFQTAIAGLQGAAQVQDLQNIVNSLTGVGWARMEGNEIRIGFDPEYISEKTLRSQLTEAGYPPASGSPS